MSEIIYLYKITPQEEIFCQHYILVPDTIYAAYHAGYCRNLKDEVSFDNLSHKQRGTLSKAGCRILDKKNVKERISELAREQAEKTGCLSLDEILNYLSMVVRKSQANFQYAAERGSSTFINSDLVKNAINSISLLIKRYPDFADEDRKEDIIFQRGVK